MAGPLTVLPPCSLSLSLLSLLQRLEKVISGMYLGEIVRLALVDIAEKTHLFGDQIPPRLMEGFTLK